MCVQELILSQIVKMSVKGKKLEIYSSNCMLFTSRWGKAGPIFSFAAYLHLCFADADRPSYVLSRLLWSTGLISQCLQVVLMGSQLLGKRI